MKIDTETLTPDGEIVLWKENSERLAAALSLVAHFIADGDLPHCLITHPVRNAQVTLGHVLDGAILHHEVLMKELAQ